MADGYKMRGGFFYCADYGVIIDYSRIDSVVEQIWQGAHLIHGTVSGNIQAGFDTRQIQKYWDAKLMQSIELANTKYHTR